MINWKRELTMKWEDTHVNETSHIHTYTHTHTLPITYNKIHIHSHIYSSITMKSATMTWNVKSIQMKDFQHRIPPTTTPTPASANASPLHRTPHPTYHTPSDLLTKVILEFGMNWMNPLCGRRWGSNATVPKEYCGLYTAIVGG